jgi:hypothetical protein
LAKLIEVESSSARNGNGVDVRIELDVSASSLLKKSDEIGLGLQINSTALLASTELSRSDELSPV